MGPYRSMLNDGEYYRCFMCFLMRRTIAAPARSFGVFQFGELKLMMRSWTASVFSSAKRPVMTMISIIAAMANSA